MRILGAACISTVLFGTTALLDPGWAAASGHAPARLSAIAPPSHPSEHAAARSAPPREDMTRAAGDSSASDADLAATHEAPWNPPEPVRGAEAWETVVRAPLRVATFPMKLLGIMTEHTMLYVERTSLVPRVQLFVAALPRYGLYLGPASLGDRTGLGGAFRYQPPALDSVLAVEIQGSTRKYSRLEIGLERGPGSLAYTNSWRPRDRFFGIGLATSDELPSSYSFRTQHVRAAFAYPWQRVRRPPPRTQARVWAGPREMILHHGREKPSFEQRFPPVAGLLDRRQEHFVYGVSAMHDGRSGMPHWSRGWRASVEAERYDRAIEAFTLRDAHTDAPQFTRFTFLGEAGASFMRDPRTVRVAVKAVNLRVGSGSAPLLLPDLSRLGGNQGLSGFEPGRFHDQDLIVGKLTYIFPLTRNFEFDLHAETGGVFPRLEKARLTAFRNSYGLALRPRLDTAPIGSFGIDWSAETVRFRFSFGGVE